MPQDPRKRDSGEGRKEKRTKTGKKRKRMRGGGRIRGEEKRDY